MPRRDDLHTVLIIGSGPIVIGQACEFDYSGSQACKALREEGIRVVLVNSNPATIMTDPEVSDRTYIEPITAEALERVIAAERPDAVLPTLGGQTGLNVAVELADRGALARYGVELIGARLETIRCAEDRELFKARMQQIGLDVARSGVARTMDEARQLLDEVGLPAIIRASFTLGGAGSGIAYNREEYEELARAGLEASPIREILVEESLIGWKEFELEVMRDRADNAVIVCSIENIDPMGVHTGDSMTVAPQMTLSDEEYQRMRDAALAAIRAVGVETGGANIQFAVEPRTGRQVVIEMNPRVSRSSALASKATGFPIAKIAAKLAIGYRLDELPNDITRKTPACFEPALDYVVVKIPRFTFEKFPEVPDVLTTSMKSVGEVMAIGRSFKEALQKALRSLDIDEPGLGLGRFDPALAERRAARLGVAHAPLGAEPARLPPLSAIRSRLSVPNSQRLRYLRYAFKAGLELEEIHRLTGIDPWFLREIRELVCEDEAALLGAGSLAELGAEQLRRLKRDGYADAQLAQVFDVTEREVRAARERLGVRNVFKSVDTCAAEFEAFTPYYYSTCEEENEVASGSGAERVVILGSGPNRIGQGIEFDYCCVHAALALREDGYETVMINSNPETVSTDYDTSDRLYFEPLTLEDVLAVCEREQPRGVIVQFGGQTPLKLAAGLERAGVPILGTSVDSIDLAEDRQRFSALARRLGLLLPRHGLAVEFDGARRIAAEIGYPVLVRPSYVLGGRAMEIVYDDEALERFLRLAVEAAPDHPVLIDEFLEDAIEVDVDAVADRTGEVLIGGIMEHIEEAGTHSGDSSCTLPPYTLSDAQIAQLRRQTIALARALRVVGLMNVQFALKGSQIYCLEVNPRASRTVPFVSKATGVPLAKIAARVMLGRTLAELGVEREVEVSHISIKKSVFPWKRFPGADIISGPEMKSTGEVMGIDRSFGLAIAKAQLAAGRPLPVRGTVFVSVKDADKRGVVLIAQRLEALGFDIVATRGTYRVLQRHGLERVRPILKVAEGRPNILDAIKNRQIDLVINTPSGKDPRADEARIRALAVQLDIPCLTTLPAAMAAVSGIEAMQRGGAEWIAVRALQDYHAEVRRGLPAQNVLATES
ncbi:MAG: carbamoyl-phosphate synthase (glutamine-hydrolyzing) [Planctomycetota bacterium]|nr:MAG: carbamoyl-phosphate synthase (glutamine-hydrolyzing) [Planctomycetota bacterium]